MLTACKPSQLQKHIRTLRGKWHNAVLTAVLTELNVKMPKVASGRKEEPAFPAAPKAIKDRLLAGELVLVLYSFMLCGFVVQQ